MIDLRDTYVLFKDGGEGKPLPVGPSFWPDVMSGKVNLDGGLVTVGSHSEDWPHWEMHPEGEELVVLLSGSVDLIVDRDGKEIRCALREVGQAWLNLRGDWHRAIVNEPAQLLFITYGAGTQHRPVGEPL